MIAGAKRREAAVKAAEEKTAAKAVETVETKAVKAEVETVAKAEPVKAETVAETAPKAAEKKTARKTATKKAPAKKAAEKAVEAPAEKAVETKTTIILEYCGRQVTETTMIAGAKKVWAEAGRTEAIETMELYVKPEDGAAYYVVNKVEGKLDL